MPKSFGRRFVLPRIVDYLQRYPDTQISAAFLDRVVNLLEEGFDVGIRIGELPDSSMRAIRVGAVRTVVCASPGYLEQYGTPTRLDALHNHSILTVGSGSGPQNWRFEDNGKPRPVRILPRLTVTTNDAAVAAAELGFGIVRLLSYQVAPEVAEGKLALILRDFEPPPSPIHIVHREGRIQSAKVRTFVDLMVERLRSDSAINSLAR
jgi:DNA-binding transcriptional LysR family regulator